MTLENILGLIRGFLHHKVAGQKTSNIIPKMSHSALAGDPIGVTLATNRSIFIKWPYLKLLGLKIEEIPTSQSGSPNTKAT